MPDEDSGESPFNTIFDSYRVTGLEDTYRMKASDLNRQFDLIDDYLSRNEKTHVELAEIGFQNYHRKGYLSDTDQVVVYADLDTDVQRVSLSDLTDVVLGKRHSSPSERPASVPVEFTDVEGPYQNFELFMPTHEAVRTELNR
jgi:hypothetical protein